MISTSRTSPTPYRVALVLAPVLMGAALLMDLTPQTDTTEELLAMVREHPDRWLLTGTLFLLSGLAWTVAGVGLHRTLGKRSRLVGVGGLAVAAGGATLALVDAAGHYLPALARSSASIDQQVSVVERVEGSAPLLALEIVHIAGWILGLLLVAAGLLASRVVARWIPALLIASLAGMLAFASGPGLFCAVAAHVTALVALAVFMPRTAGRATDHTTEAALIPG